MEAREKVCLSYWFPKLVEAGVPVPMTERCRTDCDLSRLIYGEDPGKSFDILVGWIQAAMLRMPGSEVFLRTGQTSGKHDWKNTCHLKRGDDIPKHICRLVEFSALVDIIGLPTDVWVVREMLPTKHVAVLPRYNDMPLVKEIRAFVRGGMIVCWHPYWPAGAIEKGFMKRGQYLDGVTPEIVEVAIKAATPSMEDFVEAKPIIEKVAAAFAGDGAWSVDVLATERGWYVTDMAPAKISFHLEGCEKAESFK